jgi:hypothetical protein
MSDENERPVASTGSGSFRIALALAAMLSMAAGCDPAANPEPREYVVRIFTPEGKLHREYRGHNSSRPSIWNVRGGAAWVRVGGRTIDAAAGWQIEVDPVSEK